MNEPYETLYDQGSAVSALNVLSAHSSIEQFDQALRLLEPDFNILEPRLRQQTNPNPTGQSYSVHIICKGPGDISPLLRKFRDAGTAVTGMPTLSNPVYVNFEGEDFAHQARRGSVYLMNPLLLTQFKSQLADIVNAEAKAQDDRNHLFANDPASVRHRISQLLATKATVAA